MNHINFPQLCHVEAHHFHRRLRCAHLIPYSYKPHTNVKTSWNGFGPFFTLTASIATERSHPGRKNTILSATPSQLSSSREHLTLENDDSKSIPQPEKSSYHEHHGLRMVRIQSFHSTTLLDQLLTESSHLVPKSHAINVQNSADHVVHPATSYILSFLLAKRSETAHRKLFESKDGEGGKNSPCCSPKPLYQGSVKSSSEIQSQCVTMPSVREPRPWTSACAAISLAANRFSGHCRGCCVVWTWIEPRHWFGWDILWHWLCLPPLSFRLLGPKPVLLVILCFWRCRWGISTRRSVRRIWLVATPGTL
jgi:hypothetical protein